MQGEKFEDVLARINREDFEIFYKTHNQEQTKEHFNLSWKNLKKYISSNSIEKTIQDIRKCATSTFSNTEKSSDAKFKLLLERISKESVITYYNIENHSQHECAQYFEITDGQFIRVLKFYGIKKDKDAHVKRIKKSKLERFGDENYNNREKSRETCLEKYDVDNPFKDTERIKASYIEKLGVDHPMHRDDIKEKVRSKINYQETIAKGRKTYFDKTGYDNPAKNPECIIKGIETKIAKGYWCDGIASKLENNIEDALKKAFGDSNVKSQYRDKRYARASGYQFRCDFYIKSLDLFIEINGHPAHMIHPYMFYEEDIEIEERLKEKNTEWSLNILEGWIVRDVEKQSAAENKSLNYLNVYPYNTLEENYKWNNPAYFNILELIMSIRK